MKKSYTAALALATIVFASCDDNAIFEKEMYKNEVALISSDTHNIFQEVAHLTGEDEITAYVVASVGGTHATEKELTIELTPDPEPLRDYNRSVFDAEESMYAKSLSTDRYEIEDAKIVVGRGERTGRAKVTLRPNGLSPDSSYFIGLRATGAAGVEINPKKNTILYQVLIKNDYASQADNIFYSMTGMVDGMVAAANKRLFPLTHNSVRMIAGNETFASTEASIARNSIILEVDERSNVTIKPYRNIEVTQLNNDPLYPNVFRVEEAFGRRTNVFLLSYEYVINGVRKVMKERVELQVVR